LIHWRLPFALSLVLHIVALWLWFWMEWEATPGQQTLERFRVDMILRNPESFSQSQNWGAENTQSRVNRAPLPAGSTPSWEQESNLPEPGAILGELEPLMLSLDSQWPTLVPENNQNLDGAQRTLDLPPLQETWELESLLFAPDPQNWSNQRGARIQGDWQNQPGLISEPAPPDLDTVSLSSSLEMDVFLSINPGGLVEDVSGVETGNVALDILITDYFRSFLFRESQDSYQIRLKLLLSPEVGGL